MVCSPKCKGGFKPHPGDCCCFGSRGIRLSELGASLKFFRVSRPWNSLASRVCAHFLKGKSHLASSPTYPSRKKRAFQVSRLRPSRLHVYFVSAKCLRNECTKTRKCLRLPSSEGCKNYRYNIRKVIYHKSKRLLLCWLQMKINAVLGILIYIYIYVYRVIIIIIIIITIFTAG